MPWENLSDDLAEEFSNIVTNPRDFTITTKVWTGYDTHPAAIWLDFPERRKDIEARLSRRYDEEIERNFKIRNSFGSLRQIAEKVGVSTSTVFRIRKGRKTMRDCWRRKAFPEQVQEMRQRKAAGESCAKIAKDLGISKSLLWSYTKDIAPVNKMTAETRQALINDIRSGADIKDVSKKYGVTDGYVYRLRKKCQKS